MRPTDILRQEHGEVRRVLALLEQLSLKAEEGEVLSDEVIAGVLGYLRRFVDGAHHEKEEQVLFPAMLAAGLPPNGPITVMMAEHEEGRRLQRIMNEAATGLATSEGRRRFASAAQAYVNLLDEHIEKENQVLFMLADRLLHAYTDPERLAKMRQIDEARGSAAERAAVLRHLDHEEPPFAARGAAK